MHKEVRKRLNQVKSRIWKELHIKYTGNTDEELLEFVNAHVRDLPSDYVSPKCRKKYKPLKPAPISPSGLFRKHGSGQKFRSENT